MNDDGVCAGCGRSCPPGHLHACKIQTVRRTPDTPELDLALALATCIGALQAQELPHDDASKALWRWRNARGMNDWPTVEGATTAPDDVLEAEVVSG